MELIIAASFCLSVCLSVCLYVIPRVKNIEAEVTKFGAHDTLEVPV